MQISLLAVHILNSTFIFEGLMKVVYHFSLSIRGKGGKRLVSKSAKRTRKVLRDNIQDTIK